jgi:hypothetical protein
MSMANGQAHATQAYFRQVLREITPMPCLLTWRNRPVHTQMLSLQIRPTGNQQGGNREVATTWYPLQWGNLFQAQDYFQTSIVSTPRISCDQ